MITEHEEIFISVTRSLVLNSTTAWQVNFRQKLGTIFVRGHIIHTDLVSSVFKISDEQFIEYKFSAFDDLILFTPEQLSPIFFLRIVNIERNNSLLRRLVICQEKELSANVMNEFKVSFPLTNNWFKINFFTEILIVSDICNTQETDRVSTFCGSHSQILTIVGLRKRIGPIDILLVLIDQNIL